MSVSRIAAAAAFARVPILAMAALFALDGVATPTPANARKSPLRIASWHYQLQNIDIVVLSQTDTDLLVIDYAETPVDGPMVPFTKSEIERLKTKPDGGRRIVLAYFSIGEAERYRYYWKPEYSIARPAWLVGANNNWPGNYRVRYWMDEWIEIIVRGQGSYLNRILDAGFDGVYLDGLGKYAGLTAERPDAGQAMMTLVKEIADTARKRNSDCIVVAQNAEELLQDAEYRATIDAIAKEDYLYGDDGDGRRNSDENVRSSRENLKLIQSEGKMVLVAEYLTDPVKQSIARAEIERDGFFPIFVRRELDATPLQPPKSASEAMAGEALRERK